MKKVIWVLMFLMLTSGVFAMNDSISVKTQPGNEVRIFVWPSEPGSVLNLDKGIADEDGLFETTFFSLNVEDYRLQVMVVDSTKNIIREDEFPDRNILNPLVIDCVFEDCTISIGTRVEKVEVENDTIENDTLVENVSLAGNESANSSVIVEDSNSLADKAKLIIITGKAIFSKEDGSISWGYSIGGFAIFVFLIVFIFMMFHHKKPKDVLDDDEKELQYMEKKVKETADKIKNVKDGKERKSKIENAKKKLAEEEAELKDLEAGGNDNKIERQEAVVEKAEDKVEDVQNPEG